MQSHPMMTFAAPPFAPLLLVGYKHQRNQVVAH